MKSFAVKRIGDGDRIATEINLKLNYGLHNPLAFLGFVFGAPRSTQELFKPGFFGVSTFGLLGLSSKYWAELDQALCSLSPKFFGFGFFFIHI